MVRPCDCQKHGLVLTEIRFPQERVSLLRTPLAGGLPADDLEMKMRPTTAATLLAEHPQLLSHLDGRPWPHRAVDRLHVAIPIEPALVIEQVHDVVARLRG